MPDIIQLLQSNSSNYLLFIPTAILLGALHGLEPGHSKSMMATFIIAVHGTVKQAILLGLSATVSHTIVVWLAAWLGLYLGNQHSPEASEPYFQLLSALLIFIIGGWLFFRVHRLRHAPHHDHAHDHPHDHDHANQQQDAHALAHERDIRQHYAGQNITTAQVVAFGLSGGLIPCPAAITVLLLCLQLKRVALGMGLVLCFSIGLALTLILSGVVAALGTRAAARRWRWLPAVVHRAPYFSAILTLGIGSYIGFHAIIRLYG